MKSTFCLTCEATLPFSEIRFRLFSALQVKYCICQPQTAQWRFDSTLLTNKDALNVDGLDEVAEQRSLVSKYLPLSQLVNGRHAHHLGGGMIQCRRHKREHLEKGKCISVHVMAVSRWSFPPHCVRCPAPCVCVQASSPLARDVPPDQLSGQ